jgi:hypothetical protein
MLHRKYYYGDQINADKIGGHVARLEGMRNAYKTLDRIPKGKRSVGRPRLRCEVG